MIKLIFKGAIRNIGKDPYQFILNIVGMGLGFTALLYIATYFFQEQSFDKFHKKEDRIYRCVLQVKMGETEELLTQSEIPMAEAAKKEVPEIEDATRLYYEENVTVKADEKKYTENRFWYADGNFLQIFDFELLEGDKNLALAQPNNVVLSENLSKKYFGDKNPIGQTIELKDNGGFYKVSGILKNIPYNSHLHFDMLASFSSLPLSRQNDAYSWGNIKNLYTFILARENINAPSMMKKFREFPQKYYTKVLKLLGLSMEQFVTHGNYIKYSLQPLRQIHLDKTFTDEINVYGNKQLLNALGIIGIFIIVIACFNFINLTTARASLRAKEIGVKKIIGSSRKGIIVQVLAETLLQCLIALGLAFILISFCLPLLNSFTELNIGFTQFINKNTLLTIVAVLLLVVALAGLFPSFVIARYNPVEVIKGSVLNWNSNSGLRNALVAFQFVVFIALVCSTIIVKKQIHFFHNQNPGFHKENVLVVKNTSGLGNNALVFKEEMQKESTVISASFTSALPSMFDGSSNLFSDTDKEKQYLINRFYVDKDFNQTLGLKLIDGNVFTGNFNEEQNNAIINRKAAELFGWTDCKNKIIYDYNNGGKNYNVTGIVEDFNFESLKSDVLPLIIRNSFNTNYLAVRIRPDGATEAVSRAKASWEKLCDTAPFEYTFLDETFDRQYKTEVRFGKLTSLFSIVSIVIACLGLLGLVSFILSRKQKEIGIRKVNGAKVSEILAMLNKDFVKWVVIAFVIATPVAYYVMNKWLENFAYKTNLSWWIFALAGVLALGIALLTVSWQSWRAATRNPVEALRYE